MPSQQTPPLEKSDKTGTSKSDKVATGKLEIKQSSPERSDKAGTEKTDKAGAGTSANKQSPSEKSNKAGPDKSDKTPTSKSDKAVTDAVQVANTVGGSAGQLAQAAKAAEDLNGPSKIMTAARIAGAAAVIKANASKNNTAADNGHLAAQAATQAALAEGASLEVAKAAAAAAAQAAGASGHDLDHAVYLSEQRAKGFPAEAELLTAAVRQGKEEVQKQKALGKGTQIDHAKIAGNTAAKIVLKRGGTPEQAIEAAKAAAIEVGGTEEAINQVVAFIKVKHGATTFSSKQGANLYDDMAHSGLNVEISKAMGLPSNSQTSKHFCFGEVAGKAGTTFQTNVISTSTKAGKSDEIKDVEWMQTFHVPEIIDGDTVQFSVLDEANKVVATTGLRCWEAEEGLTIDLPMVRPVNPLSPDPSQASAKATAKAPTNLSSADPSPAPEHKTNAPVLRIKVHSKNIAQLVATIEDLREGFESVCKELATEREEKARAGNEAASNKAGVASAEKVGSAAWFASSPSAAPSSKKPPATVNSKNSKNAKMAASKIESNGPAQATNAREERLREIFRICDQQGDGSINKREIIKMVRADVSVATFFGLSRQIHEGDGSRDALEQLFQKIDTDEDKQISWEEFRSFYMEEVASQVGIQNDEVFLELQDRPSSDGFNTASQQQGKKKAVTLEDSPTPTMMAMGSAMPFATLASSASSPALSTMAGPSSQSGSQVGRAALRVTVHSASLLPNTDKGLNNYSDAYCVVSAAVGSTRPIHDLVDVCLAGIDGYRACMMTKTIKDNLDPHWDETSTFSYNPISKAPLVFKVLDEDGPTKWDDVLGVAVMTVDDFWPKGTGKKLVDIPLNMQKEYETPDQDPVLRVKIEVFQEWQGEEKSIKLKKGRADFRAHATYVLPRNADEKEELQRCQFGTSTFNHLTDQDQRGRGWWLKMPHHSHKKTGKCAMCKAGHAGRADGDRVFVTSCPKCDKKYCQAHILSCGMCKKVICKICNEGHKEVHRMYSSTWRCEKCHGLTKNSGAGAKSRHS